MLIPPTILPVLPSCKPITAGRLLSLLPHFPSNLSKAVTKKLTTCKTPNMSCCTKIDNYFFNKNFCLLIIALSIGIISSAQIPTPYTVNIAGNQVNTGKYNFEWSVGESAAINTMTEDNLLVTNGLLQYSVANQPEVNLIASFLPDEIRVYPNPVKNILDINILHANKGKHQIELLDSKGTKIKQVQLNYNGMGALENWNFSGLPAGQYFLNIRQIHPVTGKLIKKGAYKIVKIN